MIAANFFSLLINLTCVGIVVYVIYYVLAGSRKHRQSEDTAKSEKKSEYSLTQKITISAFMSYLRALKEEGKSTIDEVLKDLEKKVGGVSVKKVVSAKVSSGEEKLEKRKEPLDTANLMLYLGAFVFLFAMLIFAGFTWSVYSVGFKVALIVTVPVVFLAVGLYIRNMPQFKTASSVFQIISAVTVGLTGVGIWNFTELSATVTFWTYWLWYSVLVAGVYIAYLYLLKEKKYRYFTLAALFSLIVSVAYSFANTPELRLLVMALLNVALYGVIQVVGWEEDSVVVRSILTVNRVLDIAIVLTLFGGVPAATSLQKVIILMALFVPWLFEGYRALFEKDSPAGHITVLAIVPKVFVLARLFGAETPLVLQLVAASAVTIVGLTEILLDSANRELQISSRLFHSVVLGFVSLLVIKWDGFLMPGVMGASIVSGISPVDILFITLSASVGFTLPFKNEEKTPRFGLALVPLVFGIASLLPYTSVVSAMLIVGTIALGLAVVLRKGSIYEVFGLISIAEAMSLTASWFMLAMGSHVQLAMTVFATIVTVVVTRKLLRSKYILSWVMPLFIIATSALRRYFETFGISLGGSSLWYEVVWVLPVLFYGVAYFLPGFQKDQKEAKVLYIFFALMAGLLSYTVFGAQTVILLGIATISALLFANRGQGWGAVVFAISMLFLGRSLVLWAGLPQSLVYLVDAGLALAGASLLAIVKHNNEKLYAVIKPVQNVLIAYTVLHFNYALGLVDYYQSLKWIDYEPVSSGTTALLSIPAELMLNIFALLTVSYALYSGPVQMKAKKFAGFGVVLALWILAGYFDGGLQWFVVPLTSYLGVMAYLSWKELNHGNSAVFETFALLIQGGTLLSQSTQGTELEKLQYGIALIGLSLILTILGNKFGRKSMYVLGLIFLVLELVIRLWVVIVAMPWWVYLAVIGVVLMVAGVYAVGKKGI